MIPVCPDSMKHQRSRCSSIFVMDGEVPVHPTACTGKLQSGQVPWPRPCLCPPVGPAQVPLAKQAFMVDTHQGWAAKVHPGPSCSAPMGETGYSVVPLHTPHSSLPPAHSWVCVRRQGCSIPFALEQGQGYCWEVPGRFYGCCGFLFTDPSSQAEKQCSFPLHLSGKSGWGS